VVLRLRTRYSPPIALARRVYLIQSDGMELVQEGRDGATIRSRSLEQEDRLRIQRVPMLVYRLFRHLFLYLVLFISLGGDEYPKSISFPDWIHRGNRGTSKV